VLRSGPALWTPTGLNNLTSFLRADEPVAVRAASNNGSNEAASNTESSADASFADWMAGVLRREGMTMEAAARQLGVSVKTVSRWVGGATEPRLRDLRRIRELFGDIPFP
jgi:DNA-binding transcriptional regulator YiaG